MFVKFRDLVEHDQHGFLGVSGRISVSSSSVSSNVVWWKLENRVRKLKNYRKLWDDEAKWNEYSFDVVVEMEIPGLEVLGSTDSSNEKIDQNVEIEIKFLENLSQ